MNARWLAVLSLLVAPLLWLWPSVVGTRTFVPYDVGQFPPGSLTLSPAQLAAAQDGANFDVTEVPVWFLPELELAQAELAAGRLPTWNPHARGGAPLHAHGLIGLCYPPNWLALAAAEPARMLGFVAWINLALGGLLAFGLLRATGLGALAAWFGALVFQLSGPMATNAFFWMRLGSYVWLPGVLWAVLALARAERVRPRHVGALGGAFAATWLAGFPPFAATTTLFGLGFATWLVAGRWRANGLAAARPVALHLLAGFALGGCLALPQVLPSLQFFPQSARETKPEFQRIADQAFDSYGLLGFVLPDAISHPSAQAATPYGGRNVLGLLLNTRQRDGKPTEPNYNYTEYSVFVGQLALLLALLGAVCGRGHHRAFAVTAWLVAAGLALFWPGVRLLYLLPLVENVWPLRWLAPATWCVAWLAAIGLDRLLTGARGAPLAAAAVAAGLAVFGFTAWRAPWTPDDSRAVAQRLADKFAHAVDLQGVVNHVQNGAPAGLDRFAEAHARLVAECRRQAPWCAGAAVLLALLALLRDPRQRRWLGVAAGLGTAVQLGLHGATVTRGTLRAGHDETPVHTFLCERAAAAAPSGGFMIARGSAGLDLPGQLPPGQLMVPGVRDLHFYSHFDGRSLQPIQRLLGSWLGTAHAGKGYLDRTLPDTLPPPSVEVEYTSGRQPRDYVAGHPFEHPLLDLLGVRYVLSAGAAPLPHAGTPLTIPGAPAGFFVQERATALPRAFAVAEVVPAEDDMAVLAAMLATDFAPARRAHALRADLPATLPPAAPADAAPRAVAFVRNEPTHVALDVAAGPQPWLVLTDTFLPGWTATIDDQPAPIVRGNHAFRLLQLPAHACRVTFTYRAPGLAAGLWLAAFATLVWSVCAFTTARRARRVPMAS